MSEPETPYERTLSRARCERREATADARKRIKRRVVDCFRDLTALDDDEMLFLGQAVDVANMTDEEVLEAVDVILDKIDAAIRGCKR